jgi:hypothetical protein
MIASTFFPIGQANGQGRRFQQQEEEIRIFELQILNSDLEFRYEREEDQNKGSGGSLELNRTRFEERINLKSRGFIYHPNLLEFRINASPGLKQESFSGDVGNRDESFLYEYDIHLNALRQKPYHFDLSASRSSNTVSRTFFEPLKIETDSYGGAFRYKNNHFPVLLLLNSQNTKEDSQDFKRDRKEKTADLIISNKQGEILNSDFRYTYKDLIESNPTKQETASHQFNFNNLLNYNKIHGISNISYLKNSGTLSTDNIQVSENFYVDHSETLTTLYRYNFSNFSTEKFSSNVHQGDTGFRHKLYKSLDTEVKVEGRHTEATDFRESSYGPKLSLSYRKTVPGGLFSAGYNLSYRWTNNQTQSGIVRVFGERITLSDAQRTFLANPNVILDSVIVRDTSGVLLTLNVNYRLLSVGNLVEIRGLVFPDRTMVLVDYDFSSPQSLEYTTLSNEVRLKYDFNKLFSFYYIYTKTGYRAISDTTVQKGASPLNDIEKNLFGIEWKWRWFNITGEYEDDRSALSPFKAWRFHGNFAISPSDFSTLTLSADHRQTDYEREQNKITFDSAEAGLIFRLNDLIQAEFRLGYLLEKGRDVDTRAMQFRGDLKGRYRSIELRLTSEYLRRQEIQGERNEFLIKLYLIRYLSIL